jgi:glycerol-3-phosphate acyltransferase PlsY
MATWIIFPLWVAFSYLIGGLSAGYWIVRWKTGGDVRKHGSGSTGATNTGRVLGSGGFTLVALLDISKGALVVTLARFMDPSLLLAWVAGFAVVVGHIWPVQLGFRGGKGIAPMTGVWLSLAPLALAPSLLLCLLLLAKLRRFTPSGLIGLMLLPLGTWWATRSVVATVCGVATLVICLIAHRDHLRRMIGRGDSQTGGG